MKADAIILVKGKPKKIMTKPHTTILIATFLTSLVYTLLFNKLKWITWSTYKNGAHIRYALLNKSKKCDLYLYSCLNCTDSLQYQMQCLICWDEGSGIFTHMENPIVAHLRSASRWLPWQPHHIVAAGANRGGRSCIIKIWECMYCAQFNSQSGFQNC